MSHSIQENAIVRVANKLYWKTDVVNFLDCFRFKVHIKDVLYIIKNKDISLDRIIKLKRYELANELINNQYHNFTILAIISCIKGQKYDLFKTLVKIKFKDNIQIDNGKFYRYIQLYICQTANMQFINWYYQRMGNEPGSFFFIDVGYYACLRGNLELLKWTLRNSSNMKLNDLLTGAIFGSCSKIINYLLLQIKLKNMNIESLDIPSNRLRSMQYFARRNVNNLVDVAASINNLRIFKDICHFTKFRPTVKAMEISAHKGYLDIVHYLHKNRNIECTEESLLVASIGGHLNVVEYLYDKVKKCNMEYIVQLSAEHGYFEIVKFLCKKKKIKGNRIDTRNIVIKGYLHIIEWLCMNEIMKFRDFDITTAVEYGHFSIVKYLLDNNIPLRDSCLIEKASIVGNFELFEFIFHRVEKNNMLLSNTIHYAAIYGHIKIVEFLYDFIDDNNNDYYKLEYILSTYTLDMVATNGHLKVLKFLYQKPHMPFSLSIFKRVAGIGHLKIFKFLYFNCKCLEVDTMTDSITNAAKYGHFDIVKFLYFNEGCEILKTMEQAVMGGHLEIVKFLSPSFEDDILYRQWITSEKSKSKIMNELIKNGYLETFKYLYPHSSEFSLLEANEYNQKCHIL